MTDFLVWAKIFFKYFSLLCLFFIHLVKESWFLKVHCIYQWDRIPKGRFHHDYLSGKKWRKMCIIFVNRTRPHIRIHYSSNNDKSPRSNGAGTVQNNAQKADDVRAARRQVNWNLSPKKPVWFYPNYICLSVISLGH